MKLLTKLSACLLGLSALLMTCKKEDARPWTDINHPPVAHAGPDITLNRVVCSSSNSVQLDASSSSDPERDRLTFKWTQISGSLCSLFDADSLVVYVNDLQPGPYAFELTVTDNSGLSAKDTVAINVTGSPQPVEVDLDVNLNAFYSFFPKTYAIPLEIYSALCQAYGGQCPPNPMIAQMYFAKNFDLPATGQFRLRVDETCDTIRASNNHSTSMSISAYNGTSSIRGQCSVNFKQLIQQGGGSFNGTCQITDGSAIGCDQNIFTNLSPLTVSGTLDVASHNITMTLKGKVYF